MNTDEILNMLEVQCDGMNRDGPNGLTFFLRIVNDIFGKTASEQHVVYDETTGRLPVFNTTAGVFRYTAPENIWRIAGVLVESDVTWGTNVVTQDYGSYSARQGRYKIERLMLGNIEYVRVPFIRSYDAQDRTQAYIIFTEDPGITTGLYRWYGYRNPTPILSDSITLCESSDMYAWGYIFPATVKLVQGFKDGDFLKAHLDVEALANKYGREKNKGEQGEDSDAIDNGF